MRADTGNITITSCQREQKLTVLFFSQEYTFRVPEDKPYLFEIGTVTATDADSVSYGDLTYYLEGSKHTDFAIYERDQGNVSYLCQTILFILYGCNGLKD